MHPQASRLELDDRHAHRREHVKEEGLRLLKRPHLTLHYLQQSLHGSRVLVAAGVYFKHEGEQKTSKKKACVCSNIHT
jgi:hypothetical protein